MLRFAGLDEAAIKYIMEKLAAMADDTVVTLKQLVKSYVQHRLDTITIAEINVESVDSTLSQEILKKFTKYSIGITGNDFAAVNRLLDYATLVYKHSGSFTERLNILNNAVKRYESAMTKSSSIVLDPDQESFNGVTLHSILCNGSPLKVYNAEFILFCKITSFELRAIENFETLKIQASEAEALIHANRSKEDIMSEARAKIDQFKAFLQRD